jgi:hypothetical protein
VTPSAASDDAQPTATAARAGDADSDKRIAQDAVLAVEDFPAGWTAADDSDALDNSKAPCDAVNDAKRSVTARANSPDFSNGETSQVANSVWMFADEAGAERAFAALAAEKTRRCFGKSLAHGVDDPKGLAVGDVHAARLSVDPVGDDLAASRLTIAATRKGVDFDLVVDLVFVRSGRAISLSMFLRALEPFDDKLRAGLTNTSAQRLANRLQ